MKRIWKWIGIGAGGLIIGLAVLVMIIYTIASRRLASAPTVPVQTVAVPVEVTDAAHGEHLVQAIHACVSCHGGNLEGKIFLDDLTIGLIAAPNLTTGAGGVGQTYTAEDWARAIRHGIGKDGRVLGAMPSNFYARLSDDDLGAIVTFLQTLPPVDNVLPARHISFFGTIIFGLLAYGDLPVNNIDHANVGSVKPPAEATADYGEYLVSIAACGECHGADLAGRPPEAAENGPPAGPNLTMSGRLNDWTEEQFVSAMRTGQAPDRQLDPEMPWPYYARMSDDEVKAIWLHLQRVLPHS
jgi:mono/diheme cytochrome c family protein